MSMSCDVDVSVLLDCALVQMTVTAGQGIVLRVLRHVAPPKHPVKVSFLGFYVQLGDGLSNFTHGLIGKQRHQFNCLTALISSVDIVE